MPKCGAGLHPAPDFQSAPPSLCDIASTPIASRSQDAILPHSSNAGITLLEVVIAVSLLSLLTVGVTTALRLGLSALSKTNTRLMANRRVTGAQRVLEQQLEGFMPVVALYGGAPDGRPNAKMPFFQGEPQSMRFVSSY